MKAISLWQPWATLIAIGAKRFETRSWAPPTNVIGTRIAICAAQKAVGPIWRTLDLATRRSIAQALQRADLDAPNPPYQWHPVNMPLGSVVCTALLWSAIKVQNDSYPAPDLFGDYSRGRWVWELREVEAYPYLHLVTGRQKFFNVDLRGERA